MDVHYRLSWALAIAIALLSSVERTVCVDVDHVDSHHEIYMEQHVSESNSAKKDNIAVNHGDQETKTVSNQNPHNDQCYRNSQSDDGNGCEDLTSNEASQKSEDKKQLRKDVNLSTKGAIELDDTISSSMLQTGIDGIVDQVQRSKLKAMEKLEDIMDQVSTSRARVLEELDSMMGRVSDSMSESRVQVLDSFDSVMEKVTEAREKVLRSLDEVIDTVAHSQLQEELQHVLDQVAASKVMKDIKALPEGIRNSLLSVRNRSYVVSGVLMAITAAILMVGVVYCYWCTNDSWSWAYNMQPLDLPSLEDTSPAHDDSHSETSPLVDGKPTTTNGTARGGQDKLNEKHSSLSNGTGNTISKLKTKLVIAKCSMHNLGAHSYVEGCDSSCEDSFSSPDKESNKSEADSGVIEHLSGSPDSSVRQRWTGNGSVAHANGRELKEDNRDSILSK